MIERRKHPREATNQAVELLVDGNKFVCELVQISNSGAALELEPSIVIKPHSKIELIFINNTKVTAKVVWVRESKIGVSFDINFLTHENFLHYEYMGYDQYRQFVRLQKLRASSC